HPGAPPRLRYGGNTFRSLSQAFRIVEHMFPSGVLGRIEAGGLDLWSDSALVAGLPATERAIGWRLHDQAVVLAELVHRGRAPEAMFGALPGAADAPAAGTASYAHVTVLADIRDRLSLEAFADLLARTRELLQRPRSGHGPPMARRPPRPRQRKTRTARLHLCTRRTTHPPTHQPVARMNGRPNGSHPRRRFRLLAGGRQEEMHSSSDVQPRSVAPRTLATMATLPLLSSIAIVAGVAYLGWRLLATGDGAQPVLFYLLLVAEAFGIVRLTIELTLVDGRAPAAVFVPSTAPVASDVIVLVDDEPIVVVRDTLIAAACVRGVESVTVVDKSLRGAVDQLTARLGMRHLVAGSDDIAVCATAVAEGARADVILVVGGDRVLLPDAAVQMAAQLQPGVAAVAGRVEEANAVRKVDRAGLGDTELWERQIVPHLSRTGALTDWGGVALVEREALLANGGFATADGSSLSLTAARLARSGHGLVESTGVVARRLAAGPGPLGLHRYSRELHTRLRRLRSRPRPSIAGLDGMAAWAAVIGPMRAVQRLLLLAVAWSVLLGAGDPVSASLATFALWWLGRTALGVVARMRASGDAKFEPWIVNDLRLMTADLAVGFGALRSSWQPPPLADRPPGSRWLRPLPRVVRFLTNAFVALVLTGFVKVRASDPVMVATIAGSLWFVTGAMFACRSVRRRQFRSSYRTDDEIDVVRPQGVRVVGLSLRGFDVLTTASLAAGQRLDVVVDLPRAHGHRTPTMLSGYVQRSGAVGDGWAAYVRFADQTVAIEDLLHEYLAVSSYTERTHVLTTV
ncbi:MAG: hypothetical protein ABI658_30520, partial [Acidimicrobiales bacterium]